MFTIFVETSSKFICKSQHNFHFYIQGIIIIGNIQCWEILYMWVLSAHVVIILHGYDVRILPDSIARIALAFASSRAVTQRCLSTSLAALMWNVCVPPFEMTNVQESSVWMSAPCRLMVPRHVCAISAWFLIANKQTSVTRHVQSQEHMYCILKQKWQNMEEQHLPVSKDHLTENN